MTTGVSEDVGNAEFKPKLSLARRDAGKGRPKAVRDLTIIRLLHDLGLRRGELVAHDVADVDLEAGTVAVIGKGRTQAVRLTLPDPTRDALARWMTTRGLVVGPLFVRLDGAADGPGRFTDTAVFLVVRDLGSKAGLSKPTRPHGLCHEAITRALDKTNGDVQTVQRFSRHADTRTVLLYDDRRRDVAGD